MEQEQVELLWQGLRRFGFEPADQSVQAMIKHLELVASYNEHVNLTAITEPREMVLKHTIDSAAALAGFTVAPKARVLDVGTGAGFPGIVWKCLRPDIRLTLLESLAKRCRFLEAVGEELVSPILGTQGGYEVVWGRAEEKAQEPGMRESFDVVTARAVAELRVLAEYCLPFCRVGGEFLALKGPSAADELEQASLGIRVLGGEIVHAKTITLPEDAGVRTLIRIRKVRPTPKVYPRKPGLPGKKPL